MPDKNYDSYKQIRDLVLMMNKELDDLKQAYINSLFTTTGIPFTKGVFDIVLPYTTDYIKNEMSPEKVRSVIGPYEILENGYPSKFNALSDEKVKEIMVDIKTLSIVLLQMEKESDDVKAQASDIMNEYVNYLSSKQLLKDKEEKLALFKEANKLEIDADAKRINDRNIKILESQISYKFLTERIDEYGYKEMEKLMTKFFDNEQGVTIINKYKAKAKRLGYNPEIFTYFINIEETFLPEEYHPFNNFFLSIYMNFGGHCSEYIPSDKIYFATITSSIASLIYHTFNTPEDEKKFIEFIKSVLDRFKDDPEHGAEIVDRFKLLNRSYSLHPDRIKADKMRDDIKRNTIFKRLEELELDNPFTDDCDVDEAMKYLNDKVAEIKKEQLEAAGDDEVEVTEETLRDEDNLQLAIEAAQDKLDEINGVTYEDDESEEDEIVEESDIDGASEEAVYESNMTNSEEVENIETDIVEETFEDEANEDDKKEEEVLVDGDTDIINVDEITKAVEALKDIDEN